MKKIFCIVALLTMVLSPFITVKAESENTSDKPVYTKRYIQRSCKAFKNPEKNDKNISNLENIKNRLNQQITKLEASKLKAGESAVSRITARIDEKTSNRDELESHIEALKGTEDPVFCYDIYLKLNEKIINKNERIINRQEQNIEKAESRNATNQAKVDARIMTAKNNISAYQEEIEKTSDLRKKAAMERRIQSLEKRLEKLQSLADRYNATAQVKIDQAKAIISELQPESRELAAQNQVYMTGELVLPSRAAEKAQNTLSYLENLPTVTSIDSDGDGIPDFVEQIIGTDPNHKDTDRDGYTDDVEIANGYNPLGAGKMNAATALALAESKYSARTSKQIKPEIPEPVIPEPVIPEPVIPEIPGNAKN